MTPQAVVVLIGCAIACWTDIREGKIYQLPNVIRTHREAGMISLDEALVNLYLKRLIAGETLLGFCNDRQEVEKLIGRVEIT